MKAFLLLAFLSLQTFLYSQINGWTFFTGADYGIPDNRFLRVFEDSKGNLWIGTYNGVIKDDGFIKTMYNTNNSGIPSNTIGKIAEDSKGNMWFGFRGGITKFDGTNWTTLTPENSSLPNTEVIKVSIDYKDRVWVATLGGVLVIDGTTQTVYHSGNSIIPVGPEGIERIVTRVTFDSKKNTWLSTQAGVVKITDAGVWSVLNSKNSGLTCDTVGPIVEDNYGNYWFGTQKGVAMYNGTNWTLYNKNNSPLPANYIWEMIQDSYGSIWISVFSNSYPYPPPVAQLSNGGWTTFNHGCLNGISTITITEDSDKKIWFATSNGLAKYDPSQATVGLNFLEGKDNIRISPNPVTSKVTIQPACNQPIKWVIITDIQGQLLMKIENPSNYEVDMSAFSTGVYFLKIIIGKSFYVRKIIKN